MIRLGASTWIWTSPFTDEGLGLVGHVKELGFDVLELAIEDVERVTAGTVREAGEREGVEFSVCGAFGPTRDLSHEDPTVRQAGVEYVKACVDLAAGVGAPNFVGPMYSAVGKARMLEPAEREQQRRWAVESLKEVAEHAAERGVGLAVEPLNRFETDLVNTAEQALELCDRVGSDQVGILLDTFHMNIDEKSFGAAIRLAGDRLLHVHACENDRGTPGTGHIPFDEVLGALRDIDYGGQLVIESFTPAVRDIAKAVSLWRPLDAPSDELARSGARFLRERMSQMLELPTVGA
jgi:D-psicose/D-tagatose/L-ribulose 3-epimerase